MDVTIDYKTLFIQIFKNLWLVLLCTIVGFVSVFYVFEYNKTPLYTAYATIYVRNRPEEQQSQTISSGDLQSSYKLLSTFIIIINSDRVITQVVAKFDSAYSANYIRKSLNMSAINDTEVMRISVTTNDPKSSADICNEILEVAPKALTEILNLGAAEIVDTATVPTDRSNPVSMTKPLIGALAGLVICIGVIFIIYITDTRIKGADDIKKNFNIPVLGEIPNFSTQNNERYSKYYEKK